MSRSPPPQWHKYPPQGSAVGPPPMPGKHGRSPERERRTSPGYDREAEWRRFQEWEKRSRKSPRSSPKRSPPRSQNRGPSPRKERSPVTAPPQDWNRRSPPRGHRPDWGRRSRSPPGWVRRSPPRYGPPRGRSPPRPRSPPRWGPPHPEWDRQRGFHPRHSPPRWGPAPPHWDSRRERYPAPHFDRGRWPPHPADKGPPPARPNGAGPAPVPPTVEPGKPAADGTKMDEGSAEEDNLENYELPDYDAEIPLGQKYVIPVSGFFCKICHKFYNSESSAKVTHCKSKTHYEKFSKWVSDKKEEAVAQKRSAAVLTPPTSGTPVPVPPVAAKPNETDLTEEDTSGMEPPTKVAKVEPEDTKEDFETGLVVKEEVRDESDNDTTDNKYDPSEPTEESMNATPIKQEPDAASSSDIASDTEKTPSADNEYMEATLYNFRKMRVQQLKENLKKRDLPLHGLKPLLLKRLEKALLAEAAEAAVAEMEVENDEEKQDEEEPMKDITEIKDEPTDEQQAEETPEEQSQAESSGEPAKEFNLTMHESDIETANKKLQWITERELERELLQLDGVEKVISMTKEENKMGRKTIVEWSIRLALKGDFPNDGLNFYMESHQRLPYRAELSEEQ